MLLFLSQGHFSLEALNVLKPASPHPNYLFYYRLIQHGVYVYSIIFVHYKIILKTFLLIHHKHMSFDVRVKSLSILTCQWEPAGKECSPSFWWLPKPHNQHEAQCPWPVEEQYAPCSKKVPSSCDGQGPKLYGELP